MKAKNFCLIVFVIVAMVMFSAGCPGTITGPDNPPPPPPPPPPEKTYTLQIQYIRNYFNPDIGPWGPSLGLYNSSSRVSVISMYRVDDYHFNGELGGVKICADYYFSCYDPCRYDGSDDSSTMVGDIFIVTVKETGFVKELKDIRPYTVPTNPYPGPKAKAAFFKLTSAGTIISDP